jgi:hypothetical protein
VTEALKRLNVNLDPETHRLFKLAAIAAGTDMTEAIKQFIDDFVARHLPRELRRQIARKKR